MLLQKVLKTAFVLSIFLLAGCVANPPPPLAFSHSNVPTTSRVGVLIDELPEIDNRYPGADCLLCLATASAMNGSITDHFKTLTYGDVLQVGSELSAMLSEQGYEVVLIDEPLNLKELPKTSSENPMVPYRSHAAFKNKWNIDYLLVVDVNFVGFQRPYASYVPTSDPKAAVTGVTYMVDLNIDQYSVYQPVEIYQFANGAWDESPAYPGLTNAFYQALEDARDKLLTSYKASAPLALSESN